MNYATVVRIRIDEAASADLQSRFPRIDEDLSGPALQLPLLKDLTDDWEHYLSISADGTRDLFAVSPTLGLSRDATLWERVHLGIESQATAEARHEKFVAMAAQAKIRENSHWKLRFGNSPLEEYPNLTACFHPKTEYHMAYQDLGKAILLDQLEPRDLVLGTHFDDLDAQDLSRQLKDWKNAEQRGHLNFMIARAGPEMAESYHALVVIADPEAAHDVARNQIAEHERNRDLGQLQITSLGVEAFIETATEIRQQREVKRVTGRTFTQPRHDPFAPQLRCTEPTL